jgi:branched-chain amino acid transport system substrate-binding protein
MGYKTATTLATDYVAGHDFTAGFVDGFQDKGGKVIQQQWFPEKTTDFTPYVVSLKKSDCFVPWLAGNFAFSGLRQFKELGVKMPIIEPEDGGVTVSPPAIKELGNLVKDITTAAIYAYTLDTPGNKEFVQAYKDKYNVLPGPMSGGGYSSAQVAMAALEKTRGQGKPEDLLEAITNVSIMTVRGPISYTKEHVGISTTWIFKIDENLVPQLVGQGRTRADKVGDKMVVKLIE